jgi:hypothetical protein
MLSARRSTRLLSLAALLLAVVVAFVRFDPLGLRADGELVRALTQRGRVAVVDAKSLLALHAEGATLVDAESVPGLLPALAGQDANALSRALEQARVSALLIEPELAASGQPTITLRARLQRFGRVPGLHGLFLSRTAVLYAPDLTRELSPLHREALATVARALVAGARPPRVSSFPEPLRRLRPVEVMVLLRSGENPRLWRSARGSSIASALITAATVARERWHEREQAMGGTLDRALPHLIVDVALLDDDGTLGERDPAFIDRALLPGVHGVAYERKGAWRYLLPDATREEGKGRASQAFRKLFVDDGLPEDSFGRHELRLYRLAVQTLATSPEPPQKDDGLSDVKSPNDVLGVPGHPGH